LIFRDPLRSGSIVPRGVAAVTRLDQEILWPAVAAKSRQVFRKLLPNSRIELFASRAYNQRQNSGSPGEANAPALNRPPVPLSISLDEV